MDEKIVLRNAKKKGKGNNCKTTGLRHSDDDIKRAVIDYLLKMELQNNISENYVEKHSDCSRSSVGRVCRCVWDGSTSIPDWTTLLNFSACVIEKSEIVVELPKMLCELLKLFLKQSAKINYSIEDEHHIYIDVELAGDKKLLCKDLN